MIKVLILRAAGTNCDAETQHAWELAGAAPQRVHLRRLIDRPALLDEFDVLTIPGGFSYGDDIAAGRIFAVQLRRHVGDHLRRFVDAKRLVLGICNGFQVLVQAGLLPDPGSSERAVCTVTANDPPGFQDRWVRLKAAKTPCVFVEPGRAYELPIAHGEGRVLFAEQSDIDRVCEAGQNALLYDASSRDGASVTAAGNPNGSQADIAGLCDPTGRVFGLMPHPERFVHATQHPCWSTRNKGADGDGLTMFRRAVQALK